MTQKYYTCPECEANFSSKQLVDGKLPSHNFLWKPCPGSRLPVKQQNPTKKRVKRAGVSGVKYVTRPSQITRRKPTKRLVSRRKRVDHGSGAFPNPARKPRSAQHLSSAVRERVANFVHQAVRYSRTAAPDSHQFQAFVSYAQGMIEGARLGKAISNSQASEMERTLKELVIR